LAFLLPHALLTPAGRFPSLLTLHQFPLLRRNGRLLDCPLLDVGPLEVLGLPPQVGDGFLLLGQLALRDFDLGL
jgi:hypothetical protein